MNNPPFVENYIQLVTGARLCLDHTLFLPTLVLTYTLIDTLAWAASAKSGGVRSCFEAWANTWLGASLPCTPTELYAARCAILHTLTSTADLTKTGAAREVVYAWGATKSEDLQASIDALGKKHLVAIHVTELFEGVCAAMEAMFKSAEHDVNLQKRLVEAAELHLVNEPPQLVAEFLEKIRGGSSGAQQAVQGTTSPPSAGPRP